jgi:hypothetical protein
MPHNPDHNRQHPRSPEPQPVVALLAAESPPQRLPDKTTCAKYVDSRPENARKSLHRPVITEGIQADTEECAKQCATAFRGGFCKSDGKPASFKARWGRGNGRAGTHDPRRASMALSHRVGVLARPRSHWAHEMESHTRNTDLDNSAAGGRLLTGSSAVWGQNATQDGLTGD